MKRKTEFQLELVIPAARECLTPHQAIKSAVVEPCMTVSISSAVVEGS